MKSTTTPYLFVEIWVPKRAPYNHPERGWPSIMGDIVKPFAHANPGMLCWALQEGRWFQLCFTAATHWNLDVTEYRLKMILREHGFRIRRYIRGSTLGAALGGSRWMPTAKQGTREEGERSLLLANACHSVCAVYLHSLVRKRGYWAVEPPQCTKQNPHGNLFESFMHLVANMTEARFDVLIQSRTRWMHEGWKETRVTCHL